MLKKSSRILSAILIAVMILPVYFVPNILAAGIDGQLTQKSEKILRALEIIQDDNNQSLTGGRFLEYVINMLGLEQLLYDNDEALETSIMENAKKLLLIEDGEVEFGESITFQTAVKILVCALGYQNNAKYEGDGYTGYFIVANGLSILRNVDYSGEKTVTYYDAVTMIYNALNADVSTVASISGSEISFNSKSGVTLLTEVFKVEKVKGYVTANEYSSLRSTAGCGAGKIQIGSKIYLAGNIDTALLVGRKVEAYVREDETVSCDYALYVETTDDNEICVIDADNINNATKSQIQYTDKNGKIKKNEISDYADVMYNMVMISDFSDTTFKPQNGKLIINDLDSDGIYDFVHVLEYKNYVVDAVLTSTCTVCGKYDVGSIQLDNSENNVKLINDGTEIALSDLKEWDILSIYESTNTDSKKTIYVYVGSYVIAGRISSYNIDKNGSEIEILGEKYKFANSFVDLYMNNTIPTIQCNASAIFYMDAQGEIAAINMDTNFTKARYGYLMKLNYEKSVISAGKAAGFKIYTEDGKEINYKTAEKFQVNDSYQNADNEKYSGAVLAKESELSDVYADSSGAAFTAFKPQLIKFIVNEYGEISHLYLNKDGNIFDIGNDELTLNYEYPAGLRFRPGGYLVDDTGASTYYRRAYFYVPGSTPIFSVKKSTDGTVDSKSIHVQNYSQMSFNENLLYHVKVYDIKDNMTPSALVVEDDGNGNTSWADKCVPVFLKSIIKTADDEGKVITVFRGYENGVLTNYTVPVDSEDDFVAENNLSCGDIILIKTNSYKEVLGVRKMFSAVGSPAEDSNVKRVEAIAYRTEKNYGHFCVKNDVSTQEDNAHAPYVNYSSIYGKVYTDLSSGCFSVEISSGYIQPIFQRGKVYSVKYDANGRPTVKVVSTDEIKEGVEILAAANLFNNLCTFIIEN